MSHAFHKFFEVKDNITKSKNVYIDKNGSYFGGEIVSENDSGEQWKEDLRFLRGIGSHENIVRFFICCKFGEPEDGKTVRKLTELCDASLKDYIQATESNCKLIPLTQYYSDKKDDSQKDIKDYFKPNSDDLPLCLDLLCQTAQGLKYLHDNDVIHRNIQPQNVYLTQTSQSKTVAKLGGFRYSKKYSPENTDDTFEQKDGLALMYMASECHEGRWSKESDIFAFGILVYYILTKEHSHPFHAGQYKIDSEKIKINIVSKKKADVEFQQFASETDEEKFTQKAMIEQMVDHDPAKRLKIDDVLYHPTFYRPQRKLDFLLTVRESLEKFYGFDGTCQTTDEQKKIVKKFTSLNEKINEQIGEEEFNIKITFQNYKYFTKPLPKKEKEERKKKKYKGGWEPIKHFDNVKLVLRALRNKVAHACDINTPEDFKKDFGVNLHTYDSYEPAKFFEIFVAKHNPKLLIGLYNAYKNNDQKCAAKFYHQT